MSGDYEIGRGKPPRHTRFAKGRSGNPKGRPKASKNFKTDLREELQRLVTIREGGEERRLTKQRALIVRQLADSLSGKAAAATLVGTWVMRLIDENEADSPQLSEEERKVLELVNQRVQSHLEADAEKRKGAAPEGGA
jgi:hypothetical protein